MLASSIPAIAGSGPEKDAQAPPPGAASGWQWRVGLGAAYRNLGDIEFRGGSYSATALLPVRIPRPGPDGEIPNNPDRLGIGPTNGFADRTYLDGYVFTDGQTADPNSLLPGTTTNWGYSSDSQVRGGSLYFAGGEYATSSLQSSRMASRTNWSDDFDGVSPVLEFEGMHAINERWSAGFFSSFLFIKADTGQSFSNFSASQLQTSSTFSVTDRYDLQGVIPPLAPYSGTRNPSGTAPLIDNIPTERTVVPTGSSTTTTEFSNMISESLRISLYTLSLGPSVAYVVDDFHFSGSLGLAVNIADVKAGYKESLEAKTGSKSSQVAGWLAGNNDTDVIPGLFIQGAAGYRISPGWDASIFGRYDWSDSISGSVGPANYSVGLSGYTLGLAVTHTF